MLKAFLSHSSDDKQIVRAIKKQVGRIWTYFDEDAFQAGEDFREAIINRLDNTNLFVLFVSKSSLQSSWVKFEIDETYWQTIQRNNIEVLVLTLDDIEVNQIPVWMRKAKFDKVKTPYLASELIKKNLFEMLNIRNNVYLGREQDTIKFYNDIIEYKDNFPNIVAITGLAGVGRRTFIKDILSNRFSLNFTVQFELSDSDGLIELYRKLLDDNIESLSSDSIKEYDQWFLTHSLPERATELARVLSIYTQNGSCPILIDNGAMLDNNGYYKQEFNKLLQCFSKNHADNYLVLIHTRVPKLKWEDTQLIHIFRLYSLDNSSCYSLFDALLKRNNIAIPDVAQVKEIADYLEGYPPSIIYAMRECVIEGVDAVCHDKTSLLDFQARLFTKYLEKMDLTPTDLSVLTAIHNFGSISISPLTTILGGSESEITASLRKCLDYNIIEISTNGKYTIAPPIRTTINRKVHRYSKLEYSKIANLLIEKFWVSNDDKKIDFSIIDLMIDSILRSGQEENLVKFKQFVLPSHLLKAAEKANQDTDWALAEKYAREALKLDSNLTDAKVILFKVLVRQENQRNLKVHNDEENNILQELSTLHDVRHYYLNGFRFWKRRKYYDAIDQFELAKTAGDDSIPTHRDLAECYYQTNQISNAQHEIESVMNSRKINNPFILDLAAKIAIETKNFDEAAELIEKQELVDLPENVAHRRATYYMKRKEFDSALEHSTFACNGERVLPQMHLLRMSIGIHLKNYSIVDEEYRYINANYKHFSADTCEILYATMLLYKRGWKMAEASFQKIKKTTTPFARNLRCKIIGEKIKDPSISQIEKEKLVSEKEELENKQALDVLWQTQCYDFG